MAMALTQAVIVARLLGPRDLGIAAVIISFTTLVFNFIDPRAKEAVVRYLGQHVATGSVDQALAVPKVAYGADLLLGVLGFAFVCASATWVTDHIVRVGGMTHLLVIFAAASVFSAPAGTSRAILTIFRRFRLIAYVQGGASILRTALMVALVASGSRIDGVVYATAASVVVEAVVSTLLAHRVIVRELGASWLQGRRKSLGAEFREIVGFMIYTDLTSLVAVFVKEADLVLVGALAGPTQAGYYRLARSASAPTSSIVLPLQQVAYPRLTAIVAAGERVALRSVLIDYTRKVGLPLAALMLLSVPVLPALLPLVVGLGFGGAVAPAMILVAGGALTLPLFWTRPALLATGQVRLFFLLASATGAVAIAGFAVAAASFGASGVAFVRSGIAGVAGSGLAGLALFRSLDPVSAGTTPVPGDSSTVPKRGMRDSPGKY